MGGSIVALQCGWLLGGGNHLAASASFSVEKGGSTTRVRLDSTRFRKFRLIIMKTDATLLRLLVF